MDDKLEEDAEVVKNTETSCISQIKHAELLQTRSSKIMNIDLTLPLPDKISKPDTEGRLTQFLNFPFTILR